MVFLKVIYKSDACIICLSTCKFIMKAKLNTLTQCFFYQKHNSTIHGILELTKMSILSYHLQKLYLTEILKKKHFITIYLDTSGIHLPENILSEYIHGNTLICSEGIYFFYSLSIYITATYMHFLIYYTKKIPT